MRMIQAIIRPTKIEDVKRLWMMQAIQASPQLR
jgi:nitrogen regulatory protein PII